MATQNRGDCSVKNKLEFISGTCAYAMQKFGQHTEHKLVPYLVPLQEAIRSADFHG